MNCCEISAHRKLYLDMTSEKAASYFLACIIRWWVALNMIPGKPISVLPSASAQPCSSPRYQGFDDGKSPRKWTEIYKGCCCSHVKRQSGKNWEDRQYMTVFIIHYYTDQLKFESDNQERLSQKLHGNAWSFSGFLLGIFLIFFWWATVTFKSVTFDTASNDCYHKHCRNMY